MDNGQVHVLLIDDNPGDAQLVRKMLASAKDGSFQLECADRLATGLERLGQGGIDALLLDLSLPDSSGPGTFERARAAAPGVATVLLTGLDDEELALRAVQMGAQDYLVKGNIDSRSLGHALRYAVARHRKQAELASEGQRTESGKVVVFVGAKGGVGTTTVALNVAACLARVNKRVIAVELRANFGTFQQQLRHAPVNNLSHLLDLDVGSINEQEISSRLVKVPFGLKVLFGPQAINEFKEIEPAKADVLLEKLTHMAEYVIVDLPGVSFNAAQATFGRAGFVGVVLDREPLSVACARILVEQLRAWGFSRRLIGAVVVNRSGLGSTMPMSEFSSQLGCGVLGVVTPAMELCVKANNTGLPFVLSAPDSAAGSTIVDIAGRLATDDMVVLQEVC